MKLNIELKDGKLFEFTYDFGERQAGTCTMPICLDSLRLFTKLCDIALMDRNKDYEIKFREIGLKALIETDIELAEKWIKEIKLRKGK